MSRSAEVREARRQMHAGGAAAVVDPITLAKLTALEEGPVKGVLPINGNTTTYNLETMLFENIRASEYFADLAVLKTFHEVVDEIYNEVTYVEPWSAGTSRLASTAFCLLYKLFTMNLTRNQMYALLNHKDSPYIRCLGFLHLRYTAPAEDLWDWMEPYLDDMEEFAPGADETYRTTIGEWLELVLVEPKYYGTVLPRIPVLTARTLKVKLVRARADRRRHKANLKFIDRFHEGAKVRAKFTEDGVWYDAVIDGQEAGKYWVTYTEFGNSEALSLGAIELRDAPVGCPGHKDMVPHPEDELVKLTDAQIAEFLQRKESELAVAHGKDYSQRLAGYKKTLAMKMDTFNAKQSRVTTTNLLEADRALLNEIKKRDAGSRSRSRDRRDDRDRKDDRDRRDSRDDRDRRDSRDDRDRRDSRDDRDKRDSRDDRDKRDSRDRREDRDRRDDRDRDRDYDRRDRDRDYDRRDRDRDRDYDRRDRDRR